MVTSTATPPSSERLAVRGETTRHRPRRARSVGRSLWWLALPALAVYAYVIIGPSARGVVTSFTDWSFSRPDPQFIGFDNYVRAFQGDAGPAAIRTLFIAFIVVVAQNVLGLGLA